MQQKIIGFMQDEEQHWVVVLFCGHTQHMRHDPPWQERPWVTTEAGRMGRIGHMVECKQCNEERQPS